MRVSGVTLLAAVIVPVFAHAAQVSDATTPVQKVLQLLADLHGKVVREGEEAKKTFKEFSEWCVERNQNLGFEIKTAKAEVEELNAAIEQATSTTAALSAKIDETVSKIAGNEADLKSASEIRKSEEKDFTAAEGELVEVIDALERAITVLEREARKGGSAMLQVQKASNLVRALRAMVEASMIGSQDAKTLTALVQSTQQDTDTDTALGAPEADAYENHSNGIIETLENLLEKAKAQLDSARTKETNARHNFEMLKQSLEDEIRYGTQDLNDAKKNMAMQQTAKATAEGDLGVTSKSLAEDEKTMSTLKQDCLMKSQDYEAETKSRAEELKAIEEARAVVAKVANGAADITYSLAQKSFLQLSQTGRSDTWSEIDLANFEAVRFVRKLAREQHSEALALLARRMASAMNIGSATGQDPFAKVRALITDMIENLQKDAKTDASHKAYCDKEMGETLAKKADKEAEIDKLTTAIDTKSARAAQLKDEVAALQKALAELFKSQSELTSIRNEEKELFDKNKPEMESGIQGIKLALKMLREYYAQDSAHSTAQGSAESIMGLLEVVESDFARTLAEMSATEASAQAEYDKVTSENKIEQAVKEQAVEYKTKEGKQLDVDVLEAKSNLDGVQAELAAILEYDKQVMKMCVEKAETYSERAARRQAEIAGLKEALSILEGEAVLLQRRVGGLRQGLRGSGHDLSALHPSSK